MKKLICSACAALLSMATAVPCCAAGSPWDGTWKINQDKSKLTGDTFIITAKPDGTLRYSDGGAMSYDFKCDGRPYPTLADRTLSCTGSPQSSWEYTVIASGTVLSKSQHTLSTDGKTMTIRGQSMHADGSKGTYDATYKRVAGTSGIAGEWLNTADSETGIDSLLISVKGDSFRFEYPASKEVIEGKLDGSDSKVVGPTIPAEVFVAYKAEGSLKLHYTSRYKDKMLEEGTDTLSADGKVITEENWQPEKPSEKNIHIYEKQ